MKTEAQLLKSVWASKTNFRRKEYRNTSVLQKTNKQNFSDKQSKLIPKGIRNIRTNKAQN